MTPSTLADLYVEELKDLYSAEQQILKALPKMIKAATHDDLQRAFEKHRQQTVTHVDRLQRIFDGLNKNPKGKKCHGMEGVIAEGAALIEEDPESAVLDAGLIAAAQHVEHYEMAGYGSVHEWAMQLGHDDHARLLQETLDEEKETDALLTALAKRSINTEAEVGLAAHREEVTGDATARPTSKRPSPRQRSHSSTARSRPR